MNETKILEFCEKHNITVNQYFILQLTMRRWEGYRQDFKRFYSKIDWSEQQLQDLKDKGIIESTSSLGTLSSECIRVSSSLTGQTETDLEMGYEIFDAYPTTFPLSNGSSFIAKSGITRENFAKEYIKKIQYDPKKHMFVKFQLMAYTDLVTKGKINGFKISQWLEEEMWELIAGINPSTSSVFKDDI